MAMWFDSRKLKLPTAADALPGRRRRDEGAGHPSRHGRSARAALPGRRRTVLFGMGCFWGAERKFWTIAGVLSTAVGYAGGPTPNPTYEEVCSGRTGHTEVVLVVYDPADVPFDDAAQDVLGEPRPDAGHAAGQRRRHAVPLGDLHLDAGAAAPKRRPRKEAYQQALLARRARRRSPPRSPTAPTFYYAEDYHQQYLAKNPGGYCGIGGTGVSCPVGVAAVGGGA